MKGRVKLVIPAQPEYVGIARLCLSGVAARLHLPYDAVEDLKVALAEACTNAIQHAYGNGEGRVTVSFDLDEARLTIVVSDKGKGFDYRSVARKMPDPEKERGLGLYLIRALVDEVDVKSSPEGSTVTMIKNLHAQKEAQADDSS